jgi:hypothetical protein
MKLGFWSDVRNLGPDGKAMGALHSDLGFRHEWQGLDPDDQSKDPAPIRTAEKTASAGQNEDEKGAPDPLGEKTVRSKNVGEGVKDTGDRQDKNVQID